MIFVDTSFFVALLDPRDTNHARAVAAFDEFEGKRLDALLLTTNNVVVETITVARHEAGHALAVKAWGDALRREARASASDHRRRGSAAFAYLKR